MSIQKHIKESSQLLKKINNLEFVKNAEIKSITNISCRNFQTTLIYNKILKKYIANISHGGHNYKIIIEINGDKPNPKYEKKLKKVF